MSAELRVEIPSKRMKLRSKTDDELLDEAYRAHCLAGSILDELKRRQRARKSTIRTDEPGKSRT